jgi:hypothetical protein
VNGIVAAGKCREKKCLWQKDLESRARTLQNGNLELHLTLSSLKEELLYLKEHVGYKWYNGTYGCGKDKTVLLLSFMMMVLGGRRCSVQISAN